MNNFSNKILKPYPNPRGYLFVEVNRIPKSIHRLVAIAFIPNPDNKPEVNHKDGNKQNNFWWNLEWMTHAENMRHASINKLMKPLIGSNHGGSKYTDEQIHEVCRLLESGINSNKKLPKKLGHQLR